MPQQPKWKENRRILDDMRSDILMLAENQRDIIKGLRLHHPSFLKVSKWSALIQKLEAMMDKLSS